MNRDRATECRWWKGESLWPCWYQRRSSAPSWNQSRALCATRNKTWSCRSSEVSLHKTEKRASQSNQYPSLSLTLLRDRYITLHWHRKWMIGGAFAALTARLSPLTGCSQSHEAQAIHEACHQRVGFKESNNKTGSWLLIYIKVSLSCNGYVPVENTWIRAQCHFWIRASLATALHDS